MDLYFQMVSQICSLDIEPLKGEYLLQEAGNSIFVSEYLLIIAYVEKISDRYWFVRYGVVHDANLLCFYHFFKSYSPWVVAEGISGLQSVK